MSELLPALRTAIRRLDEVLREAESPIVRDAAIRRFEFCFELGWKTAQKTLRASGIDVASPKAALKECHRQGWIEEAPWLAMLEDRNLTSHTHDEDLAAQVYSRLAGHLERLRELVGALESAQACESRNLL